MVWSSFAAGLMLAGVAKGEVVMKLENDGEREAAWEVDRQDRPDRECEANLPEPEREARSDGEILMLFE